MKIKNVSVAHSDSGHEKSKAQPKKHLFSDEWIRENLSIFDKLNSN